MMQVIQGMKNDKGVYHVETPLSKVDWIDVLHDKSVPQKYIDTLLLFYYEKGHESTCAQLSEKYGRHSSSILSDIKNLGIFVQKKYNFSVKGIDGNDSYWGTIMDGKKVKDGFLWIVKSDLSEAILAYLYQEMFDTYKDLRKELFFSIDPGYRGEKGKVQTQYQNLVEDGDVFKDGFFVPENVYIIGTMNDIDRSVESMDFAMRRRFVWHEVTAEESAKNMKIEGELLERMNCLNQVIYETEGLTEKGLSNDKKGLSLPEKGLSKKEEQILRLLEFCKTPRSLTEISHFLGMTNKTKLRNNYIYPLLDKNLAMTLPESPKSPTQKYYTINR